MSGLSVKDHMTLQFEQRWWKYAGAKDAQVRELFSETATRYYQRLNVLIDRPEAMAAYPLVVRRLQRLRSTRREQRRARRDGFAL